MIQSTHQWLYTGACRQGNGSLLQLYVLCETKDALDFNTVEMTKQFILEISGNWGPAKHNHNRFPRMFNHGL